MKVFLFVLVATIFESVGDAVMRMAVHGNALPARIGLFLAGGLLLSAYGTSLNLAPVEFASVTGIYIATVFVMFQLVNFVFFRTLPAPGVLVGGALIVAGGAIVTIWR